MEREEISAEFFKAINWLETKFTDFLVCKKKDCKGGIFLKK